MMQGMTRDNAIANVALEYKETWWLAWLHLRRARTLHFNKAYLILDGARVDFQDITALKRRIARWPFRRRGYGQLWVQFRIGPEWHDIAYVMEDHDVNAFGHSINNAIATWINERLIQLELRKTQLIEKVEEVYNPLRYVRHSSATRLIREQQKEYADLQAQWQSTSLHSGLTKEQRGQAAASLARLEGLAGHFNDMAAARETHNKTYAADMKIAEGGYFRTVESSELTEEQIASVLTFEDATLVLAAAGSGKSSCIVAKIGFALKSGLFNDGEILALAYNKDAAKSLADRLNVKLERALGRKVHVKSKTFHSFGLSVMVEHYGESYEPKVLEEDKGEEGRFLKDTISTLLETDARFRGALAEWLLLVPYDDPQPIGVAGDLEQCAQLYEDCCREKIRAKRDKQKKYYEPSIPTLDVNLHVRSLEERSIANWLMLRGVAFEYEKLDWDGAKRLGMSRRPYKPDFTYEWTVKLTNEKTKTIRVVHEHFALDSDGRAPSWMGGDEYAKQAQTKRHMFARWCKEPSEKRLIFIETTSAQYRDGSIWTHLENALRGVGLKLSEPSPELYKKAIASFRESTDLEKLIIDFVLRFKESGLTQNEVEAEASQQSHPYRTKLFLRVAFEVFQAYQRSLKKAERIDYADMLRDALSLLQDKRVLTPFRFVLVDEFQDISRLRATLVRSVLDQGSDDSIVFCVGDDWQTINRFAGSDVGIFTGIGTYFNRHVAQVKLRKTFRCADGIAQISRELVLRNASQLQKEVTAYAAKLPNCVRVVFHQGNDRARLETVIAELDQIAVTGRQLELAKPTVKILMRTTADTTAPRGFESEEVAKNLRARYAKRLQLDVQSVHGSKGLEADFVILVGLDSGFRGFPDERPPEPLLDLVLPKLQDLNEEERRLFYVGLTRARHQVVVLADGEAPSEYALELWELAQNYGFIECVDGGLNRKPCPKCKVGSLRTRPNSSISRCTRSVRCGYQARNRSD
ncbi:UvrD-helicase domain-containing protein [Dyella sp. 2HG41-7]|uniref:UvrD-helicase domain-containing protein n=1 Tax=Dyella sp. 2HG41-7 TaxID=2883239 RepID=UPI001F3B5B5F|nr:UvrD-helicase domain-containing protein [Dyella sp. 2HG41-7]